MLNREGQLHRFFTFVDGADGSRGGPRFRRAGRWRAGAHALGQNLLVTSVWHVGRSVRHRLDDQCDAQVEGSETQVMQRITSFLWFNDQAEQAARFYTSI